MFEMWYVRNKKLLIDMGAWKKDIENGKKPNRLIDRRGLWQEERGIRYGTPRKWVATMKKKIRKKRRAKEKQTVFCNLCGRNHDDCITW